METKKAIKNLLIVTALGIVAAFFINISLAANTAKVCVETANLRENADSNSKILKQLSQDEEVEILEKTGEWYQVKVGTITGYLRQDLLNVEGQIVENNSQNEEKIENTPENNTTDTEEKEETNKNVKYIAEDTKLKIVPSINATDIVEVKKDEEVTVKETVGDWISIETKTAKGWIRKEKLKDQKEEPAKEEQKPEENVKPQEEKILKTLYINSETVNLRKEASKDSEVIAKLSLNTSVNVYEELGEWSRVKVGDKAGYISTSLLSAKKQETSRSAPIRKKKEEPSKNAPVSGKGSNVVETAKKYIGCKYSYGASGPSSFDCSGFTSYVFNLHGVKLNRTAKAQYKNGTAISRENLQPGDLVMFGPSVSGINHVGIYIGGGKIVHAANPSRGVTIDTINSGYYNKNYVGARRVI